MARIKILVVGLSGKMGQEIAALVDQSKKFQLVSAEPDVIVDFSSPEGLLEACELSKKFKAPLVSGTTGLEKKHLARLKELSKSQPVLWASNMSLGVAVLRKMMKGLTALSNYDFQIEEIHHKKKKDSPSGTAKTLQAHLNTVTQKQNPPPLSVRGGGVFGVHRVICMGESETIILEHTALNRRLFAEGALAVAPWLLKQKAGLYEIDQFLEQAQ